MEKNKTKKTENKTRAWLYGFKIQFLEKNDHLFCFTSIIHIKNIILDLVFGVIFYNRYRQTSEEDSY